MDWKPIETAPQWRIVLVYDPTERISEDNIFKAEWFDGHWREISVDGCGEYLNPTHWMELPPFPNQSNSPNQ